MTTLTLNDVIEAAEREAAKQDIPDLGKLVSELRGYLAIGDSLPSVLTHEDRDSVRLAQEALALSEGRLDRVLAIQFNVKLTLQVLEYVETRVLGALVRSGDLPQKSSGPTERRVLASYLPKLTQVRGKLELLAELCTDTQKRLGSIRKTLDLMSRLDDNLRWAQHRQPS